MVSQSHTCDLEVWLFLSDVLWLQTFTIPWGVKSGQYSINIRFHCSEAWKMYSHLELRRLDCGGELYTGTLGSSSHQRIVKPIQLYANLRATPTCFLAGGDHSHIEAISIVVQGTAKTFRKGEKRGTHFQEPGVLWDPWGWAGLWHLAPALPLCPQTLPEELHSPFVNGKWYFLFNLIHIIRI